MPAPSSHFCYHCQILLGWFYLLISFRDTGFKILWYYFMSWIISVIIALLISFHVLFMISWWFLISKCGFFHNNVNVLSLMMTMFVLIEMHYYMYAFDVWPMIFMILTPYLHVYGACVYFIFLSDVFDVVRGGSHSHLLVKIYMMHYSPPLPV